MARLVGRTTEEIQADRIGMAREFAASHGCLVVLKGNRTIISSPRGDVYINPSGNPGMASGGTGDVLTGMIGGLLAQGIAPLEAAKWGVYLHGLAGDIAAKKVGEVPLIASDVIDLLPRALKEVKTCGSEEDAGDRLLDT
jgi:NAD(P)H-hydrate epimerase